MPSNHKRMLSVSKSFLCRVVGVFLRCSPGGHVDAASVVQSRVIPPGSLDLPGRHHAAGGCHVRACVGMQAARMWSCCCSWAPAGPRRARRWRSARWARRSAPRWASSAAWASSRCPGSWPGSCWAAPRPCRRACSPAPCSLSPQRLQQDDCSTSALDATASFTVHVVGRRLLSSRKHGRMHHARSDARRLRTESSPPQRGAPSAQK
jgi:hypothetical protein